MPTDDLLARYTLEEDPVERSALYLEIYARHVRHATETTWEIPTVRAATLENIATLLRTGRIEETR